MKGQTRMGTDWSDEILIVKLPAEPDMCYELDAITEEVYERSQSDLIVDFEYVGRITCKNLCELLKLYNFMESHGRHCVFCNIGTVTRGIFHVYGFDRIFQVAGSSEVVLKPSYEPTNGGVLELQSLDNYQPPQRRNYFILSIPPSLQVDVRLWHSSRHEVNPKSQIGHYQHGRLVDISEGGAQIALGATEENVFRKDDLIGVEFRPKPDKAVLTFDARIMEILPTVDGMNICLGVAFIGLEANPAGRLGLQEFCSAVGIYCAVKNNQHSDLSHCCSI
ncbi:MAG: PilZ domain-containing protein [Sedimentisphaerales bacterium]|nr:PilZ domain-containing protein [Sedimentisphaerales bacterium]